MKTRSFFIALILGILCYFLNPLGLDPSQNFILSVTLLCVILWANKGLKQIVVSLILILSYSFVGNTGPLEIISFIYSDTALLIMTTSLLSVGLTRSGLVDKFIQMIMDKTGYSLKTLLVLPYVLGIVLIFLIPQAFARSLILAGVFAGILSDEEKYKDIREILLFNVFLAITITYMFFSTGDIVLNGSAMAFAQGVSGETISFGQWAKAMVLPSLVTSVVSIVLVGLIFKDQLKSFDSNLIKLDKKIEFDRQMLISLIIMAIIVVFWLTKPLHGIAEWIPTLVGVLAMYGFRMLGKKDLKEINPSFIIFLTAAFSIGKVLGQNGISDAIFEKIQTVIPNENSIFFLLGLAIVAMLLHMVIGSSVASLSVTLPLFIPLGQSLGYSSNFIMLFVYVIVNIHFILAHQHANMMVGIGRQYYSDKPMIKFGLFMTPITLLLVLFVFAPWWQFVGI